MRLVQKVIFAILNPYISFQFSSSLFYLKDTFSFFIHHFALCDFKCLVNRKFAEQWPKEQVPFSNFCFAHDRIPMSMSIFISATWHSPFLLPCTIDTMPPSFTIYIIHTASCSILDNTRFRRPIFMLPLKQHSNKWNTKSKTLPFPFSHWNQTSNWLLL